MRHVPAEWRRLECAGHADLVEEVREDARRLTIRTAGLAPSCARPGRGAGAGA